MTEQIRDLCRRWRYAEAKFKADTIILEEEELDRQAKAVEAELRVIEAKILEVDPDGAGGAFAASEILRVVLDLIGEDTLVDGREKALLRKALTVLAWAEPEQVKPAA